MSSTDQRPYSTDRLIFHGPNASKVIDYYQFVLEELKPSGAGAHRWIHFAGGKGAGRHRATCRFEDDRDVERSSARSYYARNAIEKS
jgi:hypothetical protein